MARYMAMFINRGAGPQGRLLQEASFKALATAHMPPGAFAPNAGYGYGLAVEELDGHTILWHTGGMASFPHRRCISIWMQASEPLPQSTPCRGTGPTPWRATRCSCSGQKRKQADAAAGSKTDETALSDTHEYEGTYASERGERIEVISTQGALLLRMGSKRITLRHLEAEQFMADEQEYDLFPWVFIRAPAQNPASTQEETRPVIELAWGPRSYGRSGSAPSPRPHQDPVPQGLAGLYYNESPWLSSMRVVERHGSLWLNGAIPLEPLGGTLFRWGDEPASPETAEFLEFVDGEAQLLRTGGGGLRKFLT